MKKLFLLLVLVIALAGFLLGSTESKTQDNDALSDFYQDIELYKLDNGLRVLFKPDPTRAMVSIGICVKSGLITEGELLGTGISHLLEHMVFKGSKRFPAPDYRERLRFLGASINGATGYDYTYYYVSVPTHNWKEAFTILSSLVFEPEFNEQAFLKEKEVVKAEIRMREDDPSAVASRLLWENSFYMHPYSFPVLGYEDKFESISLDELKRYHEKLYVASNAVVSIIGPLEENNFLEGVESDLSDVRSGSTNILYSYQTAGRQTSLEVNKDFPCERLYIRVGFPTTNLLDEDTPALDVLASVLGQGRSSVLNRILKNEKALVFGIGAYNYTPTYKGLFIVSAVATPKNKLLIEEELIEILREPGKYITNKDLKRAKKGIYSQHIFGLQEGIAAALDIGLYDLTTGDSRFLLSYLNNIERVTTEDLKRVAREYLDWEKSTWINCEPADEEKKEEKQREVSPFQTERFVLDNGLPVLLTERTELPIVGISVVVPGGSLFENKDISGISNLTSRMLLEGTRKRSARKIREDIESLGGAISTFSGRHSMGVRIEVPSREIDKALEVLSDILLNSSFSKEEIKKQKDLINGQIQARDEDIFSYTFYMLNKDIYKNHPYGLSSIGEKSSVDMLTREDLLNFYNRFFAPKDAVLSIVGNIKKDSVLKELKKRLGGWRADSEKITYRSLSFPEHNNLSRYKYYMPRKELILTRAILIGDIESSSIFKWRILEASFSGLGSSLFEDIRVQLGASYTQGGSLSLGVENPGSFAVYVATDTEHISQVEHTLSSFLDNLTEHIGVEEFEGAKNYLLAGIEREKEDYSGLGLNLALYELWGLGFERYLEEETLIESIDYEKMRDFLRDVDFSRGVAVEVGQVN